MGRGSQNLFPLYSLEIETESTLQNLRRCFKNEFYRPVFRTAIYGYVCCSLLEGTGEEVGES